jgi:hypothetical protein
VLAAASRVYATPIVVPASAAATEASDSIASVLGSGPRTLQFAYDSTQLGGLTVGSVLTGLAFRLDVTEPAFPFTLNWLSYNIVLSTSLNNPGVLSPTFANNIGPDAVTVRSGSLTLPAGSFPGGGSPNAFGPTISFTTSYTYMGGDLLLTISHTGNGNQSFGVDAVTDAPGLYQGLVAASFNAATADAGFATKSPVVQFTAVPEPGTLTLLLAGSFALRFRRRDKPHR